MRMIDNRLFLVNEEKTTRLVLAWSCCLSPTLHVISPFNKMERTLKLITRGEVFAVVKNVNEKETLSSVRERLRKNSNLNEYSFLLFGIAMKSKQEAKTLVRDCWQREDDGSFVIEVKAADSGNPKPKSPCGERSPTEHEIKVSKMKCFSDAEIQEARELFQRERMRFHNDRLEKIRLDQSLSDWGPQELLGVIESSWVMKKTELLKLKVKEILCEDIAFTTDCKGRDSVLSRNLNSLEKAHFDVAQEYSKFTKDIHENESNRQSLEKRFDEFFSALKKSQANLQKSIEAFKKKNSQTQPTPATVDDSLESQTPQRLEEEEISALAEDVKMEYESDSA